MFYYPDGLVFRPDGLSSSGILLCCSAAFSVWTSMKLTEKCLPFPSPGSISLKIDLLKQISSRKAHVVSWNFLFNYVIILYVCICMHACVLCHNVSYISYHKLWPKSLRNTVLFNSKYFTNIQIFYFQDTNVKNVLSQLLAYFIL